MSFARQVAELILAESQSGSASWDELNGPSSILREMDDNTFSIFIPQDAEDGEPTANMCVITIKGSQGGVIA